MAAKKTFPVRFAGMRGMRECDADFRTDKPEQWQRWLKYARDNKATTVVTCLCRPRMRMPSAGAEPWLMPCSSST